MGTSTDNLRNKGARKQIAQGKLSERLIEFAQPLVEETGTEPTADLVRAIAERLRKCAATSDRVVRDRSPARIDDRTHPAG